MKLLLVSYYFPPMGGAGVQRALKFCKYLPAFGVQPVVLAAHDPSYAQDPTLLDDLPPGVTVRRVPYTPLLQRALAWRRRHDASAPSALKPSADPPGRDALLSAWASVCFPDDKAGWARRARGTARALLRDEGIDIVLSTAPPMSAHALAARLARDAGLPWVADFRDLWTDNPGDASPSWRRAMDRRTETRWLRQAAGIVTVTPGWQRRLAARCPDTTPVAFIPNGYDEADFGARAGAAAGPDDHAFRLVHTGSFYGPRDPGTLLDGLAGYLQYAPPAARPLRLRLVGQIGSRFAARLARFDAAWPGVVEQLPYVPHGQALAEMAAADALLLVVGAGAAGQDPAVTAGTLPAKIFEYLRAGPPMLLLGDPQGDAAALLRAHGRGWVADETRPAAITQALREMMTGPAPVSPPAADLARFERRALAGELAAFLRRCGGAP